jgi:trk system potassium uptake protein TrkA
MRVAIAGAGAVGRSIARELLENGHEVLLIDQKPSAIKVDSVPRAEWLLADACEISSLDDAALDRCNVVVAATGDDKVNLVVALLAKTEYGVPRVVARVNHPGNEWLYNESWGVDVAVSTPRLLSALVEEAVSVGDLVRLMTFGQSEASLVELTMPADAPLAGQQVGSIDWPADAALVAILREGRVLVPQPQDPLQAGDELFFVTSQDVEQGGGRTLTASQLPGFRHLRATLERVRGGVEAILLLLRLLGAGLLLEGRRGLRRKLELKQVARRHRVVAPDDYDLAEHGLERCRGRGVRRRGAGEQAAQEPARAVDADEPDRAHPRGRLPLLGRDLRDELGAERAGTLRALAARARDLGGDLGAHLVPQPASLGRGERLQLQFAELMTYRHPRSVLLGEHQLDVCPLKHRDLKAAEIDPGQFRVRLGHVPRACRLYLGLGGRALRGLRHLIGRPAVQVTAAVTGGASPTEHCASPPVA